MKSKSIKEGPERVFVLILDQDEEAFKEPSRNYADQERLRWDVGNGDRSFLRLSSSRLV